MSIEIDEKYIEKILHNLPLLEVKSARTGHLYNFRCPVCGDSKKDKRKKRAFIYANKDHYHFKCHNDTCSGNYPFSIFLKNLYPELYEQYKFDLFVKKGSRKSKEYVEEIKNTRYSFITKHIETLERCDTLSKEHIAKQYILKRKIPEKYHRELYYSDRFEFFVNELYPNKFENTQYYSKRIVIPFRNEDGDVYAFQGRCISGLSKLRYITINENEMPFVFGLDRVNKSKDIVVVEGPLDSLFFNNAIAVGGLDIDKLDQFDIDLSKCVFAFDNQRKTKNGKGVSSYMEEVIRRGFRLFVWPSSVPINIKDFNDYYIYTNSCKLLDNFVIDNSAVNNFAKLKMIKWKREKTLS